MLEGTKELLVKHFVVALELSGLLLISFEDVFKHGLTASLACKNLVVLGVHKRIFHGSDNSLSSVSVGFELLNLFLKDINFLLDLDHKKSSVGEVGESDGPLVEVTEKFFKLFHISLHSNKSSFVSTDDLEVKGGGVNLLKFEGKLVGISEVELDIDVIGRRCVSEHTNEAFKEFNKFLRARFFHQLVDFGDLLFVE